MKSNENGFVLVTVICFLMLSSLLYVTLTQSLSRQYHLQHMLMDSYYEQAKMQLEKNMDKVKIPEVKEFEDEHALYEQKKL
ncbi:hypothetical protein [Allofustis seminis]|uniref:hypothetical protein n=1 Tax=Allofustis seminis TaxID=166939 RepID=UPI000379AF6E|nr:hypothetical protein [Allofustis seminis]